MNRSLLSSAKYDYGTPQRLFDCLDARLDFSCDLAADASNAKCKWFFDAQTDSLSVAWDEAVCRMALRPSPIEGCAAGGEGSLVVCPTSAWLNPPYGRQLPKFVRHAVECCAAAPDQLTVVALLPARTDTAWWHDFVVRQENTVFLLRGRLRFEGMAASAPFPSAIVVFGAPPWSRVACEVALGLMDGGYRFVAR